MGGIRGWASRTVWPESRPPFTRHRPRLVGSRDRPRNVCRSPLTGSAPCVRPPPRSLARRAARVGAPVPQAGPVAAQDPARIEPHGGARPVLLHTPAARKRSASAAAGASVPLSPSAPLRARSGSCSAEDEKNDTNNHPCTSTSAFAHSSENMLITSRRFAQSVAPCSKASHAEKNVPRAQC